MKKMTFLFLMLFAFRSLASEYIEPFQTTRMLGMGGVYVFASDDAASLYQNPGYSCFTKGMNWSIMNINVGLVSNGNPTNPLQAANDNLQNIQNVRSLSGLGSLYGNNQWFTAQGFSTLTFPCFGIGAFYTGYGDLTLHGPSYPTIQTLVNIDNGFVVGGAIPLNEHVALGMNVKRISRSSVDQPIGVDTLAGFSGSMNLQTTLQNLESSGIGYGLDAGLVARMSDQPLNPTVSLSWRDLGDTAFQLTRGTLTPPAQKNDLVMGMTVDGSIPLLGFSAGLEYRHITDANTELGQKIHMGVEANLAFLDVRAGLYQGYLTYGAGFDLWLLNFDVASYAVERGFYPGQTPDQRIQAAVTLQLSLDPDFHIVNTDGGRRRLKQRR